MPLFSHRLLTLDPRERFLVVFEQPRCSIHHTFEPNHHHHHHQIYESFDSDDDDDAELCRPRGSTIGDFDLDHLRAHRRRNSLGTGNMYGYGMGLMGTSPREHMLRAQMMRGDLYSMDPLMGRMGMGGPGYGMYPGGSMYGGLGAGSMYGGMYGPGMMGRPPMVGMGIPPMGGMGMYGRPYPYRMSGLVDSHSPCLTRAKSWSAYGRLMY